VCELQVVLTELQGAPSVMNVLGARIVLVVLQEASRGFELLGKFLDEVLWKGFRGAELFRNGLFNDKIIADKFCSNIPTSTLVSNLVLNITAGLEDGGARAGSDRNSWSMSGLLVHKPVVKRKVFNRARCIGNHLGGITAILWTC